MGSNAFVRVLGLSCCRAALIGVIVAVAAAACGGRSRADENDGRAPGVPTDDDGGGRNVPTGGSSPMGGTFPSGGTLMTGGTGVGGSTSFGGDAGIAAMGGTSPCGSGNAPAAGTGGAAPPNSDPECESITSNAPCALEGKLCVDLACGPGDIGRRQCACTSTWNCTACSNTGGFDLPPSNILLCPSEVADGVACLTENTVCGPLGNEYCACYRGPAGELIWDCACPPSTWN